MVEWHHRHNGHEFGWTLGVGNGQGGLVCCGSWGHKESDMTEQLNWTECLLTSVPQIHTTYVYVVYTYTILPLLLYIYTCVCLCKYCVINERVQIKLMVFVLWLHGLRGYDWKISIFLLYLLNVESPQELVLYECHLVKNIHLISFHFLVLWAEVTIFLRSGDSRDKIFIYITALKCTVRTSIMVQWLRICLPMQGTWVPSLVLEDSTCYRATKSNWTPCALEPMLCNKRNRHSEKPTPCN